MEALLLLEKYHRHAVYIDNTYRARVGAMEGSIVESPIKWSPFEK